MASGDTKKMKQFKTLVGEGISGQGFRVEVVGLINRLTALDARITKLEDDIMEWETTHDMAAPGSLLRRHEAVKHERAKCQKELNALRASVKVFGRR